MDEGTRQESQVDTTPGDEQRSPEEIQREIEATREELGDTVEALAGKADVKSRAKERIAELTPDGASAGAEQVGSKVQQNPLPFAIGAALLAGFVIGRLTSR